MSYLKPYGEYKQSTMHLPISMSGSCYDFLCSLAPDRPHSSTNLYQSDHLESQNHNATHPHYSRRSSQHFSYAVTQPRETRHLSSGFRMPNRYVPKMLCCWPWGSRYGGQYIMWADKWRRPQWSDLWDLRSEFQVWILLPYCCYRKISL
jgi:hypothetical protein